MVKGDADFARWAIGLTTETGAVAAEKLFPVLVLC